MTGVASVLKFFGVPFKEYREGGAFREEWETLSEEDRETIANGIADGSFDYPKVS